MPQAYYLRRPPLPAKVKLIMVVLAVLAAIALWFAWRPDHLAALIQRIWPGEPVVISLDLTINGQSRRMRPGQFIQCHPLDVVAIESFVSNRWHNQGLRLYSPDFDAAGLAEPVQLIEYLGEEPFSRPRQFVIQVKAGRRVIAEFYLLAGMSVMDWAAKADQAEKPEEKIKYFQQALRLDPKDRVLRDKLAFWLDRTGDYKAAAELYEKTWAETSDPATLKQLLGVYRSARDKEKIVETYGRLIAAGPEAEARAWLKELAAYYRSLNDLDKLTETCQRLLETGQAAEAVTYLKEIAALYLKSGNWPKLEETYDRLIKAASPAEARVYLQELIEIYRQADNYPRLVETYGRLIAAGPEAEARSRLNELARLQTDKGHWEEAVKTYETLRDRLPPREKAAVSKRIGLLYAKNDQTDRAIEAYEAAARLDQKDYNLYLNLAYLYQSKGNAAQYADNLAKALSLSTSDGRKQLELAAAFLNAGDKDKAEGVLKKILEKEPDLTEARLRLIQLLQEKGDKAQLAVHYEYLVKKDPTNKILLYNLGVLYYEANDLEKSGRMMAEVVKLDRDDLDAHQYLFTIYQKQGRLKEAVAEAQELLRLKPGQTVLQDYVTDNLERRKDYDGLIKALQTWTQAEPDNLRLWERLLQVQLGLGRQLEAIKTYTEIARLKPIDVPVRFKLAELQEKLGQFKEAKELYAQILEIEPNNVRAAEAHLRVSLKVLESKQGL
ncbi:MAG: tetratricopeptide repeat protein [Thermodesulfobacteriota bacterium]